MTQVPSCLYAGPSIYHAWFTQGKAAHLSALCLSIQEQNEDKQEITEWRELVLTDPHKGNIYSQREYTEFDFHIHGPN